MAATNFVDYVKFCARSGKGGAGAVHFRREKGVPKGGPDGGNGGRGGHIILRGNQQLSTLLHLKYRKHAMANKGEPGEAGNRTGAQGKDLVLDVPLGTIAKNAETKKLCIEITTHAQQYILMPGGKGGLGNTHFKSPANQTPRFAQPGEPSKEAWAVLELKLLADVGLVGFPNAGKSTLLSTVSAAEPKIADYPFTTLIPQLGIVRYQKSNSFVMADIPGIIEGAANGKGLGTRFLRHIERNAVLLFVVAADVANVHYAYTMLLRELEKHNPVLLAKEKILVISKSDLADEDQQKKIEKDLTSIDYVFISALTNHGIAFLKDKVWALLKK